MDPWNSSTERKIPDFELKDKSDNLFTFEDNFKPLVSDTLPDSEEYLAILESKLKKLKSDPNVLRQLAEKREACMQQLLSGIANCSKTDDTLEVPVKSNTILRIAAPEKQALTQGEQVGLIQYQQLFEEEVEVDTNKKN